MAAGGYSAFSAVLFLCWGLAGWGIYRLGLHPTHDTQAAMRDIVLLIVFFYSPALLVGLATLNGWASGLWIGAVLWCVGVVLSVGGLLGMAFDVGTFGDVAVRMPLFVLLALLCLIGLLLHGVAIIGRLSARDRPAGRA